MRAGKDFDGEGFGFIAVFQVLMRSPRAGSLEIFGENVETIVVDPMRGQRRGSAARQRHGIGEGEQIVCPVRAHPIESQRVRSIAAPGLPLPGRGAVLPGWRPWPEHRCSLSYPSSSQSARPSRLWVPSGPLIWVSAYPRWYHGGRRPANALWCVCAGYSFGRGSAHGKRAQRLRQRDLARYALC